MIGPLRHPTPRRSLAGWAALVLLLGALLPGFIRAHAQPAANVAALAGMCITRGEAGVSSYAQAAALASVASEAGDDGAVTDPADHRPCCAFCLPVGQAVTPVSEPIRWALPPAGSATGLLPPVVATWAAPTLRLPQPRAPPFSV